MIDSTRIKQNRENRDNRHWQTSVASLANKLPEILQQRELSAGLPGEPQSRIWKMLGDEAVFVNELTHRSEARLYLNALRETVHHWNKEFTTGDRSHIPKLKATAWLAGMPVVNMPFLVDPDFIDYVGPSIDTGFRLTRFASAKRLVISVDLAWLLEETGQNADPPIRYEGRVEMKGVATETGYPLLWQEVGESQFVRAERNLLGFAGQEARGSLKDMCHKFISEFGVPNHTPFIATDKTFNSLPENYEAEREQIRVWMIQNYLPTGDPEAGSAPESAQLQRLKEAAALVGHGRR